MWAFSKHYNSIFIKSWNCWHYRVLSFIFELFWNFVWCSCCHFYSLNSSPCLLLFSCDLFLLPLHMFKTSLWHFGCSPNTVCLSPHFRLVQTGERRAQGGNMEGIDALLGENFIAMLVFGIALSLLLTLECDYLYGALTITYTKKSPTLWLSQILNMEQRRWNFVFLY